MSLADELEAALCAPTWPDCLAHVHNAIALRTEREEPAESGLVERLRANAEDYTGELQCEAADALASRDAEIAEAAEALCRNLAMVAGLNAEIAALKLVIGEAVEVIEWYGEQARLARLIHSEGDTGRAALAEDGGKRARAYLARQQPVDGGAVG